MTAARSVRARPSTCLGPHCAPGMSSSHRAPRGAVRARKRALRWEGGIFLPRSSVMALGRLWALRRSDMSCEVRARSLHISDVHPSLSRVRAVCRRSADFDRDLPGVQTAHLRVVGAASGALSRRRNAAETVQKPSDAQPAAGAASTSSYHLPRARCNLGLPLGASALPMRCGGRLSLCARQMKHAVAL